MRRVPILLALPLLVSTPTLAQGTMEFGAVHAGAIGLGAGLAASKSHGQVVRRSYEAMIEAEKATLAQTKAIEQYMSVGCQLESKKRWGDAEKSFTYVLKVVALRDGPGSAKSLPALHHLVSVSKQQGKLAEAIDYQKTVIAFSQSAKVPDPQALLYSQIDLTDLFILKNDYSNAETIFRDTIANNSAYKSWPVEKRRVTLKSYAKVLRKLHKDTDADALEAESEQISSPLVNESTGLSTKPPLNAVDPMEAQKPKAVDAQTTNMPNAQAPNMPNAQAPNMPNAQAPNMPNAQAPNMPNAQAPNMPNAQTPTNTETAPIEPVMGQK